MAEIRRTVDHIIHTQYIFKNTSDSIFMDPYERSKIKSKITTNKG